MHKVEREGNVGEVEGEIAGEEAAEGGELLAGEDYADGGGDEVGPGVVFLGWPGGVGEGDVRV